VDGFVQIPLKLAWALTIHKSQVFFVVFVFFVFVFFFFIFLLFFFLRDYIYDVQGMSIDKEEVHLQKVTSVGEGYVALSRATSFSGLRVASFSCSSFRVDPRVIAWAQEHGMLEPGGQVEKKPRRKKLYGTGGLFASLSKN
jgi:hypothetical protein